MARAVSDKLSASLKQPFIMENRGGAGGNLGTEAAAKAAPDGYTLLMSLSTTLTANPALYSKLPFDPLKDFRALSVMANSRPMMVVHPSVPVSTLAEFVAYAKKEPLTYAHAGPGSGGHLAMEYFQTVAGFRDRAGAVSGQCAAGDRPGAGQVKAGFVATTGVVQHVREGRLKGLAISAARRSALAPDVPTMARPVIRISRSNSYFVALGAGRRCPTRSPKSAGARDPAGDCSRPTAGKTSSARRRGRRLLRGRRHGAIASRHRAVGARRQGRRTCASTERLAERAQFQFNERSPVAKRPNFLFFITDQHRVDYLGCYGHPILKTPHIDSIAARGTSFKRFYVATPVCMPNRSTLMTGRMPSVHGVRSNGTPLPLQSNTFVDALRAGGYATALVGKSHLQNFSEFPGDPQTAAAARRATRCSMPSSPRRASRFRRPTGPTIRSIRRAGSRGATSR